MSIKSPILLPWRKDLLKNSKRGDSFPTSEQDSTTCGLDGFQARLQEEGISQATSDLISRSRRPNSNANYESAWRKLASWCSRREIDSFPSNINKMLTISMIYIKKDCNAGLLTIIDQQFLLFMNRYKENR